MQLWIGSEKMKRKNVKWPKPKKPMQLWIGPEKMKRKNVKWPKPKKRLTGPRKEKGQNCWAWPM